MSWAAGKKSLYSTTVQVADYSDGARNKAFVAAFKQVIISVSGDSKSLSNKEVQSKLKDINVWVQSYSYTKQAPATLTDNAGNQPSTNLFLQVSFDPISIPDSVKINAGNNSSNNNDAKSKQDIAALLKATPIAAAAKPAALPAAVAIVTQNSVPTKSTIIPAVLNFAPKPTAASTPVLVWLVVLAENPQQNLLVDDSSSGKNKVAQALKNAARNNGVSVVLPTMDLEDISKITADDICNLDIKIIKTAAKRYGTENVLAGCIAAPRTPPASVFSAFNLGAKKNLSDDKSVKHSEWLLLNNGKKNRWKLDGADNNSIIKQALTKVGQVANPPAALSSLSATPPAEAAAPLTTTDAATQTAAAQTAGAQTAAAEAGMQIAAQQTQTEEQQNEAIAPSLAPTSISSAAAATTATTATAAPTIIDNSSLSASATATAPTSPAAVATTAPDTPPSPPPEIAANQAMLTVTNVNNLDQYAAVVKYLRSLPQIINVELLNISATAVKLKVTVNDEKNKLASILKTQQQLAPSPSDNNQSSSGSDANNANALSYNWIPKK